MCVCVCVHHLCINVLILMHWIITLILCGLSDGPASVAGHHTGGGGEEVTLSSLLWGDWFPSSLLIKSSRLNADNDDVVM